MLGIGERTLYRVRFRNGSSRTGFAKRWTHANGNIAAAAKTLGMSADALEKRLKKLGQRLETE